MATNGPKRVPRTAAVVQQEFDAFKDKVREVANSYVGNGGCESGVNEFLDKLDLAPLPKEFNVRITFCRTVMAPDSYFAEDEAEDVACELDLPDGWEIYSVEVD